MRGVCDRLGMCRIFFFLMWWSELPTVWWVRMATAIWIKIFTDVRSGGKGGLGLGPG